MTGEEAIARAKAGMEAFMRQHPPSRYPQKLPTAYYRIKDPTPEQLARREELELEVRSNQEHGIALTARIGKALRALLDEKLYSITHNTFAAYCTERFGIAKRTAYALLSDWAAADTVAQKLGYTSCEDVKIDNSSAPCALELTILTDKHVLRSLANVDRQYRERVLDAVTKSPGLPTAQSIKAIAKTIVPPKEPRTVKSKDQANIKAEDCARTCESAAEDLATNALALRTKTWTYDDQKILERIIDSLKILAMKTKHLIGRKM